MTKTAFIEGGSSKMRNTGEDRGELLGDKHVENRGRVKMRIII